MPFCVCLSAAPCLTRPNRHRPPNVITPPGNEPRFFPFAPIRPRLFCVEIRAPPPPPLLVAQIKEHFNFLKYLTPCPTVSERLPEKNAQKTPDYPDLEGSIATVGEITLPFVSSSSFQQFEIAKIPTGFLFPTPQFGGRYSRQQPPRLTPVPVFCCCCASLLCPGLC